MVTTHTSSLQDIYFDEIKNGNKIYEIRINDKKRRQINIGDIWIFKNNNNNEIKTVIKDKNIFSSFNDALKEYDLNKILPSEKNMKIQEAIKIYNSLDNGYYEKNAKNIKKQMK